MSQHEKARPRYFTNDGSMVHCTLCPHLCVIRPGAAGRCGVRTNLSGAMTLPYYGAASALAVDPMEKKPVYHFLPGTSVYSIGFVGCSLHCPFCQNFRISQSTRAETRTVEPQEVVAAALDVGAAAIAYTYNEPVIHFEFVIETARYASRAGLKNVLVTSGQINAEPAEELFSAMDATNIDLKSFDTQVYRRELGGHLEAVQQAIEIAHRHCHVEVTTLVVPGKNDRDDEIDRMSAFLAEIDRDIVYHLSGYFPSYRYDDPPTAPSTLDRLASVARRRLRYVYLGNVARDNDTHCPECGSTWIKRRGYHVEIAAIHNGVCDTCGVRAPVILA